MTTLNQNTNVPIYVVVSAFILGMWGTVLYFNLKNQIDDAERSGMSQQQFQQWLDAERVANQVANPSIMWTGIPIKYSDEQEARTGMPTAKN